MGVSLFASLAVFAAVISGQYFSKAALFQRGHFFFNYTSEYNFDCRRVDYPRMFTRSDVRVHVTLSHEYDGPLKVHSSAVLWVKTVRMKGFTVCMRETGVGSQGSAIINWLALQGSFTEVDHGIEQFDEFSARTACKRIDLSQNFNFTRPPYVFATILMPDLSGRHDALNLWIENITTSEFHACVREFAIFDSIHENVEVQWFAFENNPPEVWNSTATGRVMFDNNTVPSKNDGYAMCKDVRFDEKMFAPPVVLATVNHNSSAAGTTPPDCNTINSWVEEITQFKFRVCVKDLRGNDKGDELTVDYTVLGDPDPCINVSCEYFAVCKSFAAYDPRCLCVEECPAYEEQVCSSNATTFKNRCFYELEMCRLKSNHTLYHPGSCTGFPVRHGRVQLTQNPSFSETACETVPLSPYTFYPDAAVYVQATVNHWNTTEDDSVHEAVEAWVENVNLDQFTVCVTKAGRDDYPRDGFASVDWFAYQGAPKGAVADRTRIPDWWTGTKCQKITLPRKKFKTAPTVLVTAEHMSRGMKHDAASLWLENITSTSFTVCLRELQNFDGLHADVQVSWLAFVDVPRPLIAESSSVYFENDDLPTEDVNGAFCKDVTFSRRHDAAPTVILSTNHNFEDGRIDPEYTGISSWVEYINSTGFRACLKQQYAKQYDPLTVSYAVLSDICDDGWDYFSGVCFYTSSSCKRWLASQQTCRDMTKKQGNLATVRNQEENVYIQYRHGGEKGWIGFNDRSFEGDFDWAGKKSTDNFTYWAKNQPNDLGGEDCVHTLGVHHDFKWNDVSCDKCYNYTCSIDLDECQTDRHSCHSGAICTNNFGSYSCACDVGYSGDGQLCIDLNECLSSPCDSNATCINTEGSYICQCNKGYTGNGFTCQDLDECATGLHACDANANCTNTVGSYDCTCIPTYHGDGKKCTSYRGLGLSSILGGLDHTLYLGRLMSFLDHHLKSYSRTWFGRCYHAKSDGWSADTFHKNCDGKGPTVTIIQVNKYIFGGYTDTSWYSSDPCVPSTAKGAFIFSLYNKDGYKPLKLTQVGEHSSAIYGCKGYGPTFGKRTHDIYIADPGNNHRSSTGSGFTYHSPDPKLCKSHKRCSFYAGTSHFTPTDIEVFYEAT